MAAAAPFILAAGAISSAIGSVQQGDAQADSEEFNANVATQNAALSRAQAAEDERRTRVTGRKVLGAEGAAIGASGIQREGGSAMDVLQESASNAELDALTVKNAGEVKARSYEAQAANDMKRAGAARTGGYFGAAASILGGAGKMAGLK